MKEAEHFIVLAVLFLAQCSSALSSWPFLWVAKGRVKNSRINRIRIEPSLKGELFLVKRDGVCTSRKNAYAVTMIQHVRSDCFRGSKTLETKLTKLISFQIKKVLIVTKRSSQRHNVLMDATFSAQQYIKLNTAQKINIFEVFLFVAERNSLTTITINSKAL